MLSIDNIIKRLPPASFVLICCIGHVCVKNVIICQILTFWEWFLSIAINFNMLLQQGTLLYDIAWKGSYKRCAIWFEVWCTGSWKYLDFLTMHILLVCCHNISVTIYRNYNHSWLECVEACTSKSKRGGFKCMLVSLDGDFCITYYSSVHDCFPLANISCQDDDHQFLVSHMRHHEQIWQTS